PTNPSTTSTDPTSTITTPTVPTTPSTTSAVPTNTTTATSSMTSQVATSNPCLNGGTWQDGKCFCPGGFQGDFCNDPVCQNGGTWVNGLCQCPPNFQGDSWSPDQGRQGWGGVGTPGSLPYGSPLLGQVTINATVEMTTKVDVDFHDDLNDKTSEVYRDFESKFQNKGDGDHDEGLDLFVFQTRQIYGHIEGYRGVEIRKLSQGSIVVDYEVLLEVPANSQANKVVENISKDLVTAFKNYTDCEETCTEITCE
ncbi:Mucin-3A, partial [Lamprotornis superbus]